MVSTAKRQRLGSRERKSAEMGELRTRKRHKSDYMKVEDDIEFLIGSKRPKLSEDELSEDRNSPDIMKQIKDIKLYRESEQLLNNVETKNKPVKEKRPASTEKVTEDTREQNRRSPNGFLLPDPLPRGEVLTDTIRQQWVLGKPIGVGGFGELYMAAFRSPDGGLSPEKFVVKVEPHSNGPLFVEVHFYLRATKQEEIEKFKREKGLAHLGVPRLIANGSHVKKQQNYRFLVMERFGSDLQRILDNSEGQRFTTKTACSIAIQVVDSLEYIHRQGYVHKDIKGSNLLVGLGMEGQHLVHLVDYGLCSKFRVGDLHKQYRHDVRWAHEGTMEYTSRDAHIGSASRRGDLEVLLYNLIEWFGGSLPWDRELASPQVTKTAKFLAFRQMGKFLRICFRGQKFPLFLVKFMKYISNLMFEDEPDYEFLRGLITEEMVREGCSLDGKLEFRLAKLGGETTEITESLPPDLLYGPSKKPPSERVSAIFDTACVSATSYEKARDIAWAKRSKNSLKNPTQAMLEIMTKMNKMENGMKRKRTKSFSDVDNTNNTPAMMEVMKLKKLKSMDDAYDENNRAPVALLSLPFKLSPVTITKDIIETDEDSTSSDDVFRVPMDTRRRKMSRKREAKRLEMFKDKPETTERRRTRSEADDTKVQREIRSNLRSAFNYGIAPVRSFMRSVSNSLPKLF